MTEGLSAATVVAMRTDLERDFPSRSFVLDVLELLRLMCEGHNEDFQNFLREQPNESIRNVDLVSEVYLLLSELEPEADETNIDQVHDGTRLALGEGHTRTAPQLTPPLPLCRCTSASRRSPSSCRATRVAATAVC